MDLQSPKVHTPTSGLQCILTFWLRFCSPKSSLPVMIRHDHGHIVNVSSSSALLPLSKIADYAATKAGFVALHEVRLAHSLAQSVA